MLGDIKSFEIYQEFDPGIYLVKMIEWRLIGPYNISSLGMNIQQMTILSSMNVSDIFLTLHYYISRDEFIENIFETSSVLASYNLDLPKALSSETDVYVDIDHPLLYTIHIYERLHGRYSMLKNIPPYINRFVQEWIMRKPM
jgi:hypothetical protein